MTRFACAVALVISFCFLVADWERVNAAAAGPNDYFNALLARGEHWKSYSLRDQAQLLQYKNASSLPPSVNYVWPNDPDPHAQDAAKVVIPVTSSTVRSWR